MIVYCGSEPIAWIPKIHTNSYHTAEVVQRKSALALIAHVSRRIGETLTLSEWATGLKSGTFGNLADYVEMRLAGKRDR